MKMLYVGPLNEWGTCYSRLIALQRVVGQVSVFDTTSYLGKSSRVVNVLENMLGFGPSYSKCNAALWSQIEAVKPKAIWIDKGFWIDPKLLSDCKKKKICLIEHVTDDVFSKDPFSNYRRLRAGLKYLDVFCSTNIFNVQELSKYPIKKIIFSDHAFDERWFPRSRNINRKRKVVFAGHWEPASDLLLTHVFKAGIDLEVYGWGWHRTKNKGLLGKKIFPGYLVGKDYVDTLMGSQIAIGLLSKWNRNLSTPRIYEIPASGALLLAERTEETQTMYVENKEAMYFSTPGEAVSHLKMLLSDTAKLEAIATAGHKRCWGSEYTWESRVRPVVSTIREMIGDE